MLIIKKLAFSIPFLLAFYFFTFQLNFFFQDIYLIFGFGLSNLYSLIYLTLALLFSSLFFVIFISLASDWRIILPISLVASLSALIFFKAPLSLILTGGFLLSFAFIFWQITQRLKSYPTFEVAALFNPSIKTLASLLILVSALAFYLSANLEIQTKGFQIPDSLIDTALKLGAPQTQNVQGVSIAQVPTITQDQLEFLKQNPALLKQYNIDPASLNSLPSHSPAPSNDLMKNLIKGQIQNLIKPYLGIVPPALALIFFITLQSLFGLAAIFLSMIVQGIFWILERSGFIRFEIETREVKKMVV